MITDRTADDVANINPESTASSKGAYNYTDLNRVEAKVKQLNDLLIGYSYMTPLTTKLNWAKTDFFTPNDAERYLNNVKAIRQALASLDTTPNVPSNMNSFNYEQANDIEKILVDIEMLIHGMKNYFVYCGVANAGQPRIWQHRFRQRLMAIWTNLTETYWSDFGNTKTWEEIIYEDNY